MNLKIREILNIQQNIFEVTEERRLKWFGWTIEEDGKW